VTERKPVQSPLSQLIWQTRYAAEGERDVRDSWSRVAAAVASVEATTVRERWRDTFHTLLQDFSFLPAGRILAGAGLARDVTLFNCFVMGPVPDDMAGIFEALKEGALTMQQGGGVGYDFSTLRPAGVHCDRVGGIASGPVSFMRIWDSMCATLLSTAARRGAMMGTLRCDHPDIERFVDAKRDARELRNFNLSVLASDDFMAAVAADADWPLVFPLAQLAETERQRCTETVQRRWSSAMVPEPCAVLRRVPARQLWQRIMRANYDTAEPGVLFIDRINAVNNLYYREWLSATNPCGEIPLPAYGACDLGSLNLTAFVRAPFSPSASLDMTGLADAAATATRLLDNVIDLSRFPLPAQAEQAQGSRRIGLGITGLADALAMLGLRYDSEPARRTAAEAMRTICHAAYRASIALAEEKGSFPYFDREAYLAGEFTGRLPADIRDGIARQGIRNSHLTAIAPAGTISLLADNLSSGIEPIFEYEYRRRVRDSDGGHCWHQVEDHAVRLWKRHAPGEPLPDSFVDARGVSPEDHLAMQAALQPYVDNAISKTVNVPDDIAFEAFEQVYLRAHELGLKGCTTFRPNPVTGSVLESVGGEEASHCCGLDREMD
jgi:ribonucleoside-diphosphate reductase alpha chain